LAAIVEFAILSHRSYCYLDLVPSWGSSFGSGFGSGWGSFDSGWGSFDSGWGSIISDYQYDWGSGYGSDWGSGIGSNWGSGVGSGWGSSNPPPPPFDIANPLELDQALLDFADMIPSNPEYQAYLAAFNAALANGYTSSLGDINAILGDTSDAIFLEGQWYAPDPTITHLTNQLLSTTPGTSGYGISLRELTNALSGATAVQSRQIQDVLISEWPSMSDFSQTGTIKGIVANDNNILNEFLSSVLAGTVGPAISTMLGQLGTVASDGFWGANNPEDELFVRWGQNYILYGADLSGLDLSGLTITPAQRKYLHTVEINFQGSNITPEQLMQFGTLAAFFGLEMSGTYPDGRTWTIGGFENGQFLYITSMQAWSGGPGGFYPENTDP
jgi:hypothetical protein